MRWYLNPAPENAPGDADDTDLDAGMAGVPAAILRRHGARILDPATAAAIPGQPRPGVPAHLQPQSTVYRARTLLIPPDLRSDRNPVLDEINAVLKRVGMSLRPVPDVDPEPEDGIQPPDEERLPDEAPLPGLGVLEPAAHQEGRAGVPVVVDAWVALQALRAAADTEEFGERFAEAVGRITLEHLLFGQAVIMGSPVTDGGGLVGAQTGGLTGPTSTDSYLYNGGDARTPVDVCLKAPDRHQLDANQPGYDRRVVVAVLDTGVREHAWLDVLRNPGAAVPPYQLRPDGFVDDPTRIQRAIYRRGKAARAAGDQRRQLIEDLWDDPVSPAPLVGELDTHTGHGTFIAGIVRQIAPDAQVLAIRVMHSDGIVYEGDLLCALGRIAARVRRALNRGSMAGMVDVLSLSFGYFSEYPLGGSYGSWLLSLIGHLRAMGVAVTASAGNNSTRRPCYPAAFAVPKTPGVAPLLSVGALNPDGSRALFSDGGWWINAWASGGAVLSTFPTDIDGSRKPEVSMRSGSSAGPADPRFPGQRAALDPDNYHCGFALWSGTSFSAPLFAALLAGELLNGAKNSAGGLGLGQPGITAAIGRIDAAMAALNSQDRDAQPDRYT